MRPPRHQRSAEANRPSSEGQSLDGCQVVGLVPEGHHRCGTAPDLHRLPCQTPSRHGQPQRDVGTVHLRSVSVRKCQLVDWSGTGVVVALGVVAAELASLGGGDGRLDALDNNL